MFAGDRRRERGLHAFFTSQLRHQYLPHVGVHVYTTVSDRVDAAAACGVRPTSAQHRRLVELVELLPAA